MHETERSFRTKSQALMQMREEREKMQCIYLKTPGRLNHVSFFKK
jgi:hypothetical protein